MEQVAVQLIILGVCMFIKVECQEYSSLNAPSRASFAYHSADELSRDVSEIHPVFLYASSQNDYVHQNLPEHAIPPAPKQQQTIPRPKYTNSPLPVQHNFRKNIPLYTPPLTYGFTPKLPTGNRQSSTNHRQQNIQQNQHKNQQNQIFRGGHPQEPVYQASIRHATQQQNKQFTQNIQVQSTVQQNRQNANAVPGVNYQRPSADFNVPFNYLSHILTPEKHYSSPAPNSKRPNTNNPRHRYTVGENRKPNNSHNQRNQNPKEERKQLTFHETAQAFKNRYNQANQGNFPQTTSNIYYGQNDQSNNERINMQHHVRSMRGDNKPQLPPRPPFHNGGIKINTVAGELPILNLNSESAINENPIIYPRNNYKHDHIAVNEQEKKTYLLIKAPPLTTTELPLSVPYVVESLQQTTSPYILNGFEKTSLRMPEITYSTRTEPHTSSENSASPTIVLDLVQIPDHTAYNQQEKHFQQSVPQPDYRSTLEEQDIAERVHPTESYPTTPMQAHDQRERDHVRQINDAYDHIEHIINAYNSKEYLSDSDAYSPLTDDNIKYQSKVLSKPKIKDSKKPSNFSSLQPISYSSSVSVVSVKQNVNAKPTIVKKQKTTSKKTISSKKVKIPANDDYMYDDYDGDQNIPGEPGRDYPTHNNIPQTSFQCKDNKSPGFYADTETGCQVFHNCDTGMAKHSFMCPNGTIFHQELFICDWWYNVRCEDSNEFYSLNSGLFVTNNGHDESKKA